MKVWKDRKVMLVLGHQGGNSIMTFLFGIIYDIKVVSTFRRLAGFLRN